MKIKLMMFVFLAGASVALCSCRKEWVPVPESSVVNQGTGTQTPEESETWTEINGNVSMTETKVVEQGENTFMKGYWPDGKLIPVKKDNSWQLFWSESTDVLTVASTPFPEDHISDLTQENTVWGKEFDRTDGFNDGGSWFISVFPLDEPGKYVGFFHAESHWDESGIAHKSIGVVYSDDYGATWHDPKPIITDKKPKPAEPDWTGLGDGCVIWDEANSRYICYYQGKVSTGANALCMASSSDRTGASGTWKKWDGSDFTLPAYDSSTDLGGENIPVSGLAGVPGANPSVMWNDFLGQWVMVYASWTKRIYMSFSNDAIAWSTPQAIVGDADNPAGYPNLISEEGDLKGGETVRMYWANNQNTIGIRELAYAKIRFRK